ncbi:hypothetical protein JTB14_031390 [Gonioctena quinquepunctata]|nr:hypothetical protein JTB14_031390 [Gonioctena quinquepunctata]
MDYMTSKLVNLEAMRNMVSRDIRVPGRVPFNSILKTDKHDVVTKQPEKVYKVNTTKSKFVPDPDSVPYGYKHPRMSSSKDE